jgi:hypothetical protein
LHGDIARWTGQAGILWIIGYSCAVGEDTSRNGILLCTLADKQRDGFNNLADVGNGFWSVDEQLIHFFYLLISKDVGELKSS